MSAPDEGEVPPAAADPGGEAADLHDQAAARQREGLAAERVRAARGPGAGGPSRIPRCEPPRPAGPEGEAGAAYAAGLEALEADRLEEAEEALRRALARDSRHPGPWRELGILLADLQRFDEALRPLDEALALDPEDFELLRFRALCLERIGQPAEAAVGYAAFLEACPEAHSRIRLHAARRQEALTRELEDSAAQAEREAEAAEGRIEEVPADFAAASGERQARKRVVTGLAVLGAVLLLDLLLSWGSAPPPRPELRRARLGAGGFLAAARSALASAPASAGLAAELAELERAGGDVVPVELLDEVLDALEIQGDPASVQALGRLLGHPDPRAAARAVGALGRLGPPGIPALGELLLTLRRDGEQALLDSTLAALAGSPEPEAARALVAAFSVASRPGRRSRWERAYLAALERALRDADPDLVGDALAERRGRLRRETGPAEARVLDALAELEASLG